MHTHKELYYLMELIIQSGGGGLKSNRIRLTTGKTSG